MKINQSNSDFKSVTITFETHEELKKFVDEIGELPLDAIIPYDMWDKLDEIVYGSSFR